MPVFCGRLASFCCSANADDVLTHRSQLFRRFRRTVSKSISTVIFVIVVLSPSQPIGPPQRLRMVVPARGVASFKPGTRIEHLKNLPDLRVILVNSKVERNTSRMVQTVKERLKKFPDVVEGIFTSIDAISREAAKILHRPPEENGETLDKLENGGHGTTVPDNDHHSLQIVSIPIETTPCTSDNSKACISQSKHGFRFESRTLTEFHDWEDKATIDTM
ncbi:hypothetical protein ANCDUO_04003 [Ancylostoma duodenale]|uniref:Uncharacterized protein n=1 Tax=Ancylostoma duodenale TaxID=51022 RepID=A0A0C2H853_9BILA|nr:hypothetical protein ANCDUO_04003 [Ancylostoma duodenale]